MKINSTVELDAKITLVVCEFDNERNDQQTQTMCLISIARSLKRLADTQLREVEAMESVAAEMKHNRLSKS